MKYTECQIYLLGHDSDKLLSPFLLSILTEELLVESLRVTVAVLDFQTSTVFIFRINVLATVLYLKAFAQTYINLSSPSASQRNASDLRDLGAVDRQARVHAPSDPRSPAHNQMHPSPPKTGIPQYTAYDPHCLFLLLEPWDPSIHFVYHLSSLGSRVSWSISQLKAGYTPGMISTVYPGTYRQTTIRTPFHTYCKDDLESSVNVLRQLDKVGSTGRKPTQAKEEHANSTP